MTSCRVARPLAALLLPAAIAFAPHAVAASPAPGPGAAAIGGQLIPVQRDPAQQQGEQPGARGAAGPQRKAVLDALRIPIEARLKQPVVFVVSKYAAIGEWAFVIATPKRPDGGEIAWSRTVCQGDVSHLVGGLMKRTGEVWAVRAFALCPTDVAWEGWPAEHGAPKELFAP